MCGIIGYLGKRNAQKILIEGLKKLEYRGYDSAGICLKKENELFLLKRKGKIKELELALKNFNIESNCGIAHTRWATHGEPNEKNSHPHLDCKKEIAIVHNGIVENYSSLKKILILEGHKIVSETDSEIIAHLIEKFYKNNLEEATMKAFNLLEGAIGLAVISKKENRIIVVRRGSPLVLGMGENETFVSSDVSAIIEHTNKIIYLKDNEIANISMDNFHVKNSDNKLIEKEIYEIKWTIDQIEKGNFKHFMLKEIFEQPESIKNTLRGRINHKINLSLDIDLNKLNKIILVACGTSWHSALIGKYLIEKFARIPVEVDYASEFRYRDPLINEHDLVVALSQSGETADTLAAIKEAKNKGAKTMGVVNVVGSTITHEVDFGIYLHVGPETGVASTKAFTSQVVSLALFALYLRQKQGKEMDRKFTEELKNIPEKISEVLTKSEEIKEIAKKYANSKNCLYFGRGINFPVALEGALKLKEISYIHAEGYPAAEMKHGPIALIDENMPIVFIATKSFLDDKILSNIEETKARKGKIIAIISKGNEELKKYADHFIEVPEVSEELSPIINTIVLQLFAYHVADLKGLDVDKPRNLAKSVTVE
jgi:glucosamine--fructose-6-phosphate aminotransferase (isomerizing)